jgi:hypothetical protein
MPNYQPPALFQASDQALNRIAVPILPVTQSRRATRAFPKPSRDSRLDASVEAPLPDPIGIIQSAS